MTPNRKRYLEGISEEERVIRNTIKAHKCFMCDDKSFLNDSKCTKKDIKAFLTNIHCRKILIKNLKKQLPAPKVVYETKFMVMLSCPRCKLGDMLFADYCPYCGQKLG